MSPVDYAFSDNPDGSASVWVGNVDRVTGMQWRCEYVLRPSVGVLEQHVTLENRSNVRRRYYFWANAGVKLLSSDDRFIIPANVASIHGSGFIDTWPVGVSGKDWSVIGSYTDATGYFAIGSREDYMGFYQKGTKSGLLHIASSTDVPGKKTWTWALDTWPNANLSTTARRTWRFRAAPPRARRFTTTWNLFRCGHSRKTGCRSATWAGFRKPIRRRF